MSLVEYRDCLTKYVNKGSLALVDMDSSDNIRFHLITNPLDKLVVVIAYPKEIGYRGVLRIYRGGYTPEKGLLFPNVERERINQLSERVQKLDSMQFHSNDMIDELSKSLDTEKDKFINLICENARLQLVKTLDSKLYEIADQLKIKNAIKDY